MRPILSAVACSAALIATPTLACSCIPIDSTQQADRVIASVDLIVEARIDPASSPIARECLLAGGVLPRGTPDGTIFDDRALRIVAVHKGRAPSGLKVRAQEMVASGGICGVMMNSCDPQTIVRAGDKPVLLLLTRDRQGVYREAGGCAQIAFRRSTLGQRVQARRAEPGT